jgi:hypothetical protein
MTTEATTTTTLETAAREFIARRDRTAHPAGKFDNAGRWYPSEAEECDCCNAVRSPSRSYPYSYMTHCRTMAHVAHLFSVDVKDLRREVKRIEGKDTQPVKPTRLSGTFYKQVAVLDDGRMVSIFDGKTEYVIGQELRQAVRKEHGGGFYVYAKPEYARYAELPARAVERSAKRAIIAVQASGQYTQYDNGKIAFSRVTPVEVVAIL